MSLHVVAGAGSTGSRTALVLAEAGERVRLISRRGLGPEHPMIERVIGDTTDVEGLTTLTAGAQSLINTTWPAYDRWPTDFPPIAAGVLVAAERTGANYVSLSNTYGYGRVGGSMTEDLPMSPVAVKGAVRARIWLDALAAHEAGRVRITEVRASDYLGRDAGSVFNFLVTRNVIAGSPARYPGDPDVPKSWSYVDDVARTLAAVARDDRSWGRAWHVPSTIMSLRDVAERLAKLTNSPAPQLIPMSLTDLAWAGATDPIMAELIEMYYSLEYPDVLDSALTQQTFDLFPTPIDTVLTDTARFGSTS
ncbi:NAD-dependent epimerase/dehydratase family protein [Nocardia aurantiaca]|uniref:NAD-dependent epimerase/dehydratase family protein n=1 Tax=Nocardia aurantiaca TaxID=2675850 RepID=A0A6I3LAL3_9NOCA|nr:NAD-dependent epimerase/dehydratase family protein [Nocardia aurantiaca]MTE17196.1 NAD-dependent epimerase/dehydratase family protein [Nocardia aurantiaca]